jgi:serine/threonine protein phosphatase PrpC
MNDIQESVLKNLVLKGFAEANRELKNQKIDLQYSGSTGCTLIVLDQIFITANLGDSRAIIVTIDDHNALTYDHKPCN